MNFLFIIIYQIKVFKKDNLWLQNPHFGLLLDRKRANNRQDQISDPIIDQELKRLFYPKNKKQVLKSKCQNAWKARFKITVQKSTPFPFNYFISRFLSFSHRQPYLINFRSTLFKK